jgi:hypothetical protein
MPHYPTLLYAVASINDAKCGKDSVSYESMPLPNQHHATLQQMLLVVRVVAVVVVALVEVDDVDVADANDDYVDADDDDDDGDDGDDGDDDDVVVLLARMVHQLAFLVLLSF